jgi:hypothetical protein
MAMVGVAIECPADDAATTTSQSSTQGSSPVSFPAWDRFTEELRQAGHNTLAKLPPRLKNHPQVQQEIGRLLLEALAARTLDAIASDGDHPVFLPWSNQTLNVLQPNADTVYRKAVISPGGSYRLRGERGSLRLLKLAQLKDPVEETGDLQRGMGVLAYHDFADLRVDSEGRFDVLLSPSLPEGYKGDWWQLHPEANALWVRQVASDWSRERDPRISIERVDQPVTKPRIDAAELEGRLLRLAATIDNTAGVFVDHVERLRQDGYLNKLKVWETHAGGKKLNQIGGLSGQFYYEGAYEIAPDEALLIEAKVPEKCAYWSIILTNDIYETTDWYNNHSSLNGTQAHVDKDGKMRVIVSARDPAVPNWLDTAGHLTGAIQGRWTECDATPIPSVRKIAFADVRKQLPPETPVVTPQQREQLIRERRSLLQQRPLW